MGDINIFKCNASSVNISSLCRCKCLKTQSSDAIDQLELEKVSPDIVGKKNRESIKFVNEGIVLTAKKIKYTEYDTFMIPGTTFILISGKGIILGSGGDMIENVFLNKRVYEDNKKDIYDYNTLEGQDVNVVWKAGYLNVFYAVYRSTTNGKRSQVGATINGKEYRIISNFTNTKKNKIESVLITIRPIINSISDIEEMYLTTDDSVSSPKSSKLEKTASADSV